MRKKEKKIEPKEMLIHTCQQANIYFDDCVGCASAASCLELSVTSIHPQHPSIRKVVYFSSLRLIHLDKFGSTGLQTLRISVITI